MQKTFEQLVLEAAEMAKSEAYAMAREGRCGFVMELFYGRTQPDYPTILVLTACEKMVSGTWTATGRKISSAVPYSRYATWIRDNAGDLPLFN